MKPQLIIVGLGNPGSSHARTRHNAGFQAIDVLSENFGEGEWKDAQKFLAETQEGRVVTVPILLVKPQTFMNRSGECIRKIVDFYKINPLEHLLVLTDELDLPVGSVRFREKGGPGTHNGLRSIVECIGEGFPRIRIGIGPEPVQTDLASWVVSAPSAEEAKNIAASMQQIPDMVKKFVMGDA